LNANNQLLTQLSTMSQVDMEIYNQIKTLVAQGALFAVSNSGGKDSQAMLLVIRALVPAEQILVIHAELPGVEWESTESHARAISEGLEYIVVRAKKTFFEMVEHRQNFPSAQFRQCTSDLKRGPINKAIRAYMKAKGYTTVVSCMGLRSQESGQRKCGLDKKDYKVTGKAKIWRRNEKLSRGGRTWIEMLPIHNFVTEDVWAIIKEAGQKRHWAYDAGMSRLSCPFCIMSKKADLQIAAKHNPELYRKYVETEKRIGKTMFAKKGKKGEPCQPIGLEEFVGVKAV
jgi:DNA sulfur modification protein DndC